MDDLATQEAEGVVWQAVIPSVFLNTSLNVGAYPARSVNVLLRGEVERRSFHTVEADIDASLPVAAAVEAAAADMIWALASAGTRMDHVEHLRAGCTFHAPVDAGVEEEVGREERVDGAGGMGIIVEVESDRERSWDFGAPEAEVVVELEGSWGVGEENDGREMVRMY